MFDFLFQLSDAKIFAFLSLISITISIIGVYIIKYAVPLSLRYKDNATIGYTSALISVIYGVLAGLTAIYLFNNNDHTADAVQREANSTANIYRASQWLTEPVQTEIKNNIKEYLNIIINTEWPEMQQGKMVSVKGDEIINNISQDLSNYYNKNPDKTLVITNLLQEINALYDARHQRIYMSHSQLNPEIWEVIIIGTILTLFINYLFGMNLYLHIFIVIAAALMTSSVIFLMVTLDRPFQGEFVIQPDSFKQILASISNS